MKKHISSSIIAAAMISALCGCGVISPTGPADMQTPTADHVTITVEYTGHYTPWAFDYNVSWILLTRNSTGVVYEQQCSVPFGATVSVNVAIPADGQYSVGMVNNSVGNQYSIAAAFPFVRGTAYTLTLNGDATLH